MRALKRRAALALGLLLVGPFVAVPQEGAEPVDDLFPLTRDRFGTLGAPPTHAEWEALGASWFKSGDCYWQADWVPESDVQPWLLIRPRMYFTGNNREWNPKPNPASWQYRDKTRQFLERNADRIGIVALGNSICYADIESGYQDADEYVTWYHDFRELLDALNPRIKLAPGDLQSAWGGLQGTDLLPAYMRVYRERYGHEMPIDAVGLHCYLTGNNPPEWAQPEVVSVETFRNKIRAMRAFMKRIGLRDTPFVITEMGVFNHCCDPPLTEGQLIDIMCGAIEFVEGPEGVDQELGMPSDGCRLVQKWSYSAFTHLVQEGELTPMGRAYRALVDKYAR